MSVSKSGSLLLFYVLIVTSLLIISMESVVNVYLTDTYNPNYFLYQALLYSVAVYIVFTNRHNIKVDGFMKVIWAFSILCFLLSFVRLEVLSIRRIISLLFNTFIIPFAILNGQWLGEKLSNTKSKDYYLLLLQVPVVYTIFLLQRYNSFGVWFDADAAFCVIVFLPFVFFYDRKWLSFIFILVFVLFALTSAKRSILVFVATCLLIFLIFELFFISKTGKNRVLNRVIILSLFILGAYYIVSVDRSSLIHAIERTESLGGIGDSNGRESLYTNVAVEVFNSDFISFFCGHGQFAVKRDFGMSAHNDLLEIAYDYGIIAAVLYLSILVHYLKKTIGYFRRKSYQSAMRLGICISSIIILGMLNCIIASTMLVFIMYLALGCATRLDNPL